MFHFKGRPFSLSVDRGRRLEWYRAAVLSLVAMLGAGCSNEPVLIEGAADGDLGIVPAAPLKQWPKSSNRHSPGHQKMLVDLADVLRRTADENVWVGDAKARLLRSELAAVPLSSPLGVRSRLKNLLAEEELKQGNEQEAIRLLREVDEQDFPVATSGWQPEKAAALRNSLKFSLGVAFMRLGETENCCRRNSPDSCILPIQGTGVHTDQEGSRRAIDYFAHVVQNSAPTSKMSLRARWLLNIAYMTIGGYPDDVPNQLLIAPESMISSEPFPRFVNVAGEIGLGTFSLSGGAVADDFDNDGYLDLVVSSYDPAEQIKFFHNNRDGTFSDRTEDAGLQGILGGLNVVQADYDNDGWLDLLVLRGAWLGGNGQHPNSLLRNDGVPGAAQFTDVTYSSGLGKVNLPTQTAAWADYDSDGDLDLYIGNEAEQGQSAPCQLFRNNGDGTFDDVAARAGVTNDRFTKAVVWGDYNDDGLPDIYVSNFLDANRLYHNNGDGTFSDLAVALGVTGPHASFPAWFWDYDNDGILDLYASSWSGDISSLAADALSVPHEFELARLYRGTGEGSFDDVAEKTGLTRPTGPMGSNFGDLNSDGYPDFYLGTGDPEFMNLMPNVMYLNKEGSKFADVTTSGGFGHLQKGHAVVFADFDNDGDQDVFEQMGGAVPGDKFYDALYENPGNGNHWISISLRGVTSNRSAIGARIRVDVFETAKEGSAKTMRSIYKWVNSGGSFGANPLRQNIGLGESTKIDQIQVFWPTTGKTQILREVEVDQTIEISEGRQGFENISLKRSSLSPPSE